MKKFYLICLTLLVVGFFSCEEETSEGGGIFSSAETEKETERWSIFLNPILGMEKYYIKVEIGGGSGSGVVSVRQVSQSKETSLGNFTVYEDLNLYLTDSGPVIKFSSNGGFNLVAPDEWVIMFDSGQLLGIFPTGLNTSTVAISLVSPRLPTRCQYGYFNSFPNINISIPGGATIPQMIGMGMQVKTSAYGAEGEIPETSILQFSTAYPLVPIASKMVKAGDSVTISYLRKVVSDGKGGDYFAMIVTNNRTSEVMDGVQAESASQTRVSRTFKANGDFFGVQLVFGLSEKQDAVWIDDFQVKVNNKVIFHDDFEAGTLQNGLPNYFWQTIQPATMLGSAEICATQALSGTKSFCARGGRSFILYGQGMSSGEVSAMEFTLSDGSIGSSYFVGSFMGATQGSVMYGTYSGRNFDQTCTEEGGFFNLINSSHTEQVEGKWDLSIKARLKNCDNPAEAGELNIKLKGLPVTQVNSLFGGILQAPDSLDSLGNTISSFGIIRGQSLMFSLMTKVPASRFYRLSLNTIAGNKHLTGQVSGWSASNPMMLFQTCELKGEFKLEISR